MIYRPKRLKRGRLPIPVLAALAAAVLWAAVATAEEGGALPQPPEDLALRALRTFLMDREESALPASLSFILGQSPLLLSGREAVLELRRGEEQSDGPAGDEPAQSAPEDTSPISEQPLKPEIPLVIADNGVSARTLVPVGPEGYTVWGDVYINNCSDRTVDAAMPEGDLPAALVPGASPQVLILHTHGSEAYTMPEGEEYVSSGDCRTTDGTCNVLRVGDEIAAVLTAAGITVLHDRTLHDHPQYSGAYERSLATAEAYLEEYPTIALVLDIHRDAVTDSEGTMYKVVSGIGGVNAAQMAFVVGTDGGGLSHSGWMENLTLAAAIQQTILEDFPTLMRPITVRNSRYNQHVSPGALLVEMGAAGNSLEEALLSARLLARAILSTLAVEAPKPLPAAALN